MNESGHVDGGAAAEEADLVAGLRAGRPEAARRLYDEFGPGLLGFVRRRVDDPELAPEVVQDVMTKVWRSADRYDPAQGPLRAWVFQIARNATTDARRRSARRLRLVHPGGLPAGTDDAVADTTAQDDVEAFVRSSLIGAALDRLPAPHREVVDRVYLRQLTVAEAAADLGIPEGTVKSRCFYALQNLRTAFHELGVIRGDL